MGLKVKGGLDVRVPLVDLEVRGSLDTKAPSGSLSARISLNRCRQTGDIFTLWADVQQMNRKRNLIDTIHTSQFICKLVPSAFTGDSFNSGPHKSSMV